MGVESETIKARAVQPLPRFRTTRAGIRSNLYKERKQDSPRPT